MPAPFRFSPRGGENTNEVPVSGAEGLRSRSSAPEADPLSPPQGRSPPHQESVRGERTGVPAPFRFSPRGGENTNEIPVSGEADPLSNSRPNQESVRGERTGTPAPFRFSPRGGENTNEVPVSGAEGLRSRSSAPEADPLSPPQGRSPPHQESVRGERTGVPAPFRFSPRGGENTNEIPVSGAGGPLSHVTPHPAPVQTARGSRDPRHIPQTTRGQAPRHEPLPRPSAC